MMRITILAHPEFGIDETFCSTIGEVAAGLRKASHRVSVLGVQDNIGRLISGLKRRQPDLVFNLMEREPAEGPRAAAVVGLLELLGLPHTGNCPGEFYIQDDPEIARKLLDVSEVSSEDRDGDSAKLFRVGLIGDEEATSFEPIAANDDRSTVDRFARTGSDFLRAEGLRKNLLDAAVVAYRALRVRDYGVVELQVIGGRVVPIGVRTDCDLGEDGELARSAKAAGMSYPELVGRIAETAMARAEQRQLVRLI
jgi:hypothetical protein